MRRVLNRRSADEYKGRLGESLRALSGACLLAPRLALVEATARHVVRRTDGILYVDAQ